MTPQMIHGVLVHFPIAFLVGGFFFELLALIFDREWLSRAALILLLMGVIGGAGAIITGDRASGNLSGDEALSQMVETHATMAHMAIATAGIAVLVRLFLLMKGMTGRRTTLIVFLLALLSMAFVLNGGRIGGELVYKHGAGISH